MASRIIPLGMVQGEGYEIKLLITRPDALVPQSADSDLCPQACSQVRAMPLHPDHAASFTGETLHLVVIMPSVKAPIVTHTNAYVGHLRQLVRAPRLHVLITLICIHMYVVYINVCMHVCMHGINLCTDVSQQIQSRSPHQCARPVYR